MKKFSWSKLIAIALSVFIVIQFVEVSFLAAGQIGGARADAGSDASRGSIAGDIYQGVWDKVGDGDMILTAGAAGESTIGVRLLEASAGTLDLSGAGENAFDLNFALSFTPAANAEYLSLGSGKTISIALPEGIQGNFSETDPVSVTRMEAQEAADPEAEPALESVSENRDDIVSAELNDNVLTVTVAPIAYEQLFTAIDDAHVTVSAQLTEAAAGRASATWTYPAGNDAEVTGATVTVVYPGRGSSSTAMAGPEDPAPEPVADPAAGSSEEEDAGTGASSDAGTGATSDAGEGGSAAAGTGASDAGTGASDAGTGASDAATAGSSGSTEANTANSGYTAGGGLLVPTAGDAPERTGGAVNKNNISFTVEGERYRQLTPDAPSEEEMQALGYVLWQINNIKHNNTKLGKDNGSMTVTIKPGDGFELSPSDKDELGEPTEGFWALLDYDQSVVGTDEWELVLREDVGPMNYYGFIQYYTKPVGSEDYKKIGYAFSTVNVSISNSSKGIDATTGDIDETAAVEYVPSVNIKAVDDFTTGLDGVKLSLTAPKELLAAGVLDTSTGKNTYTWTSNATGKKAFPNVFVYGYEYDLTVGEGSEALSLGTIKITDADGDGKIEEDEVDCSDPDVEYDEATNTILVHNGYTSADTDIGRVIGRGADAGDEGLSGAVFSIYEEADDPAKNDVSKGTVTSGSGGRISKKLTGTDPFKDYYLLQTKAPAGYLIEKDPDDKPVHYTFNVDEEGKVTSHGSEWDTGDVIVNQRIPGSISVIRADVKTDKNISTTDTIQYQIYEDAACTEAVPLGVIEITKETGAGKTPGQGTSDAILDWDKDYYIKESDPLISGYTPDVRVHGPYRFNTDMAAGKDALSSCTYAADKANMKITATITPQKQAYVDLIFKDSSGTSIAGTFNLSDAAQKTSGGYAVSGLSINIPAGGCSIPVTTGTTYNLTQTSKPNDGMVALDVSFTVAADGSVTVKSGNAKADNSPMKKNPPENPKITLTEAAPKMVFCMEICTAEDDGEYEGKIDKEKEVAAAPAGFAFSIYDSENCDTAVYNSEGKQISGLKTDSKGTVTISGLADGEYYVQSTQSSAVSNASQVLLDKDSDGDYSVFKVTQSGGVLTELTKVGSGGRWEAKDNKIRAKLKKGSVTIKAQSDKTFYLYRLYAGDSDSDDKRETKKMKGDTASFSASDKKTYFVTVSTSSSSGSSKSASLDKMLLQGLQDLNSLFVLKVKAADSASKISYAGQTWQLIASSQPGNGGSHTFEGLI
ncbi:MAG: hypothetical protein IKO80_00885, partial [Lachnospiraceae bacterium]|nr:hypothetical protein [Lachnospiraceae bacterium]